MSERERMIEREKLIEIIGKVTYYGQETFGDRFYKSVLEKIADQLLENDIIVPLVKVGDKVWIIMANYTIAEGRVVFTENKSDTELDYFKFCVSYYPTRHWRNEITAFITNDIGKTVFLTKEEALKALKGDAE